MAGDSGATIERGREALRRGEWAAARQLFGEALAHGDSVDAYEGLGIAARYQLDAEAALGAHERGYLLARAAGDPVAAARLAVQLGYDAYSFRGPAEAQGWVERATMLLAGCAPSVAAATIPVMRAHLALLADHDPHRALHLCEGGAGLARAVGAVEVEMRALALTGLARVMVGEIDGGMRCLDAATAALGGEMVDADAIETVCCYMIDACRRVRDLPRANEWSVRAREIARRYDDRQMFAVCRTYYAELLMWHGQWQEAEAELAAAARELAAIRPGRDDDALVRLAELRRRQGRTSEARTLLAGARSHPRHPLVAGQLALDRGEAVVALDAARGYLRAMGEQDRFERVAGLELAVCAAVACADPFAAEAAAELAATARVSPTLPLRAAASLAAGRVAAAAGRLEDAGPMFDTASALFARAGAPYEAALAELDTAAVLGQLGRVDAAARVRDRARRALQELGARLPEARPGGLTTREAQVLRLLAQGLSNEDIAHQLVLSVRTVERHIANAYAKIGAGGRTARAIATAWAHVHGVA
jgi:ATP/maltotriose-dependent transcriptional regulator MalT